MQRRRVGFEAGGVGGDFSFGAFAAHRSREASTYSAVFLWRRWAVCEGRGRAVALAGVVSALLAGWCAFAPSPAFAQATGSPFAQVTGSPFATGSAPYSVSFSRVLRSRAAHFRARPQCTKHIAKFTVCHSASKGLVLGGVPDALQNALLGFAKDRLKGFLINQFGLGAILDPTGTKLAEISAQLKEISAQLVNVQSSINNTYSLLADTKLHVLLTPLVTDTTQTFTLYDKYFAPLLRAEITYADANEAARKAGSICAIVDTPCDTALGNFGDRKKEFLAQEDLPANYGLNDQIHSYLKPTGGRDSVTKAYGTYLLTNGSGFLSSATSDQLLGLYRYFANVEALATWMEAEATGVRFEKDPGEFKRFLDTTITGDPAASPPLMSYFQIELSHLPPPIPPGAVISLNANSALRTTTINQPMWLYEATNRVERQWAPTLQALRTGRTDFEDTTSRSVGRAINVLNGVSAAGFADWKVPSQANWDSLFSGRKPQPDQTLAAFLANMNPTNPDWHVNLPAELASAAGQQRLWTSTPVTVKPLCYPVYGSSFNFPEGRILQVNTAIDSAQKVSTYRSNLFPIPGLPTKLTDEPGVRDCYQQVFDIVNNTNMRTTYALLIATRSTGDVSYMG